MTLGTHVTDQRVSLWVPIGLSVGPLVALGLARFAYALLFPAMRADLNWSYAQAGAMNAANAAGYVLGAMVAAQLLAPVYSHWGGVIWDKMDLGWKANEYY
jgi:predicted MFS family arabinose efflux permease